MENIINNDIKEGDTVKFYGFSPKDSIDENISPKHSLTKFIYYDSGKAYTESKCDCKSYRKRLNSALLEITIKNVSNNNHDSCQLEYQEYTRTLQLGHLYICGLALAKRKGLNVRYCYLCCHNHYDNENKRLICELAPAEPHKATNAQLCSNYILDQDCYQKFLEEFDHFSQNNVVDIWSK